ncbi:SurA N-terminal domain-containing protein [Mesorhizobium sp. YIM 152430]|uniref:SurA N-terminal domain-containing protein n=1 Tax=Mesorhizobium sp. YIM 152430 TaxID=3031761 RepID=UPI0023DC8A7F|nr:SurA N-terminal domain-containing protein [Mesorhizobium sp. YIM 152430]MDF1600085.1 SurA N-terminal domain-containing protein [Mesorhizobium sp. YIM 152430]
MLTWLRGKSGSLMVKLLLGLLVISFAVWGMSGQMLTGVGNHVLAVGETRVQVNEYRLAYDRQLQLLSQQFGTRISREQARAFGLEQQVLAQLVAGAVLDEQAREMDLGLSRDRLATLTAEDPAFRNASGQFDRNQFEFVLRQVGMRPDDYLRNREQLAIRQQIVDAVADGMGVPDTFLNAVALYRGEDRTAEYLVLDRSLVEPIADPSDGELRAWFDENAASFAAPEYRALDYVKLEPEDIADPAAISDAQVAEFYETHRSSFSQAEQRTISQIVFANEEAAQAAAARISSGEATFDQIATELGRSTGDLTLGTFAREDVPDPAIAEAAFALEEGGVSDVVAGSFGSLLIRVDDIVPESVRPVDEVSAEIREEMALDEASRILLDVYDGYEDARAGGATLREAAAQQNLEVVSVPAVGANGLDPEGNEVAAIPAGEEVLQSAFEAEPNMENAPIALGSSGYVFYEVTDVTPARNRELDEVRDEVLAEWRRQEGRRLLAERANEIASRLEGGAAMSEVAAELEMDVQTKRGLRRGADDADLGREGVATAFSIPVRGVETIGSNEGDRQIVLQVSEVFAPANASGDTLPENVAQTYAGGLGDDLLDQLVTRLQSQYSVTVNQSAVQQALSF